METTIEKIKRELFENVKIDVIEQPNQGDHINVGETFQVSFKLTNLNQEPVRVIRVNVRNNQMARVQGTDWVRPEKRLERFESYTTPEFKMEALSTINWITGGSGISVKYDLAFDPAELFEISQIKLEEVEIVDASHPD